ncbi:TetR/AcrR family transcriptional regulator [Brevundimonas variabilis]|uniref:AcrR family transcriptional regulator n=1 Tax=Brevundimonas variabilis TaxID=74312 RepID=A0A7W9FDX0_9CAUL|nr:TetR/AcrR family transcriptional regulator [Brevundimonas variabilis]MBB5745841.1 AcrR family transcriptional regulator [Brevundimonas variabilis]
MSAASLDSAVPQPRSARKPKGEGHSRRAEILVAAERIFVEHGYEGATIRKIADEVGLSSTALYIHFADKGAILQEICRTAFETLIAANRAILEATDAPEERLRRMLAAYVAFGFANPNAYRLSYLTRPLEARDGAENAAQQLGAELFGSFADVVDQLDSAGRLRVDAKVAAQVFWAGVHGIVSLIITKPYFPWADHDALFRTMSDALFEGLLTS